MLSKCANPECGTELRYLRDGKVFKIENDGAALVEGRKPARRVEHFWLCGPCSEKNTLRMENGQVTVTRKAPVIPMRAMAAIAAAS